MTEEERIKIIEAKQRVTDELAKVDVKDYALNEVDERLSIYVDNVCRAPLWHNLYEQLAVARFLRLIKTYGINVKAVQKFITFYEELRLPGKNGPQRYKLTPVQVFQFASIYGFSRDGRRLTREACLYVPRKFSKTTSTAAIALYDFLLGEANAEVYVGANSQDQAKKCFDVLRIAMRHLDPGQDFFTINEQVIKTRLSRRTALAQCLTSNVRTKDGLNASTVIMDEFSQAKDIGLLSVLTTSMGVRRQPLTVIITTASDKYDGPFYAMLQGYKKMLLGEIEDDPTVFAHIFEPDLDDLEGDETTWRKVQPHIGITVSEDFYAQEYANAKRNGAEAMLAFRTKLLNVYSESSSKAWVPASLIREYSRHMRVEELHNFPVATVAVDLSVRDDFSAVSICIYHAA
ncbi:MAG: terminase large subunit, partial [Oscillospiraceae bacterium]|nr:terminase large subunit [Oscillospiraceae bacterium]